jgi:filamentous hemagglutinin
LPGGAAVGSVGLPSLGRALEAIRRLVAIGALDGAIIAGIGSLGGGPSIALPELQRPTSLSVQGPGGGGGGAGPPKTGGGARFPEKPGQVRHIFRDAPGHLADTPANRTLLKEIADDASATLGTDKFGNVWSARTLQDGTQVWVQTRNGVIQNGGLNKTPRVFNSETGLSGP